MWPEPRSDPSFQPSAFEDHLPPVPSSRGCIQLDLRCRLGVEVSGAESGTAVTGLEEALAFTAERTARPASHPRAGAVVSDDLGSVSYTHLRAHETRHDL